MTDTGKIVELQKILKQVISWYKEKLAEEGEDYVYDMAYEHFNDLSRSDYLDILKILAEPNEYELMDKEIHE